MFMKYAELYNDGNRRNNYLHKNRGKETTFQYKIDEEDEKMYKNMFKAYTSVSVNEWLVSYLFTLIIYAVLLITLSVINIEMYTALWNIILSLLLSERYLCSRFRFYSFTVYPTYTFPDGEVYL